MRFWGSLPEICAIKGSVTFAMAIFWLDLKDIFIPAGPDVGVAVIDGCVVCGKVELRKLYNNLIRCKPSSNITKVVVTVN
jgi:hypothetical protein